MGNADELGVSPEDARLFFEAHWKRRIALAIEPFYQWQFKEAPENKSRDHCCVAIDPDGSLLGIMGLNDRPFWLDGKLRAGAELTTWVVDKKAQGRGVGKSMMAFLQSRYEVLAGMGITEAALQIYLSNGFEYLRSIPRFVRVFDAEAIAPYAKIEKIGESLIDQHKETTWFPYRVQEESFSVLASHIDGFEQSFNFFSRDAAHLEWRYAQHPIFSYHGFLVQGGGKGAVVILRADTVGDMKIIHVVDFLGDAADFPAAVTFIDDYCRENNASVSDFYCVSQNISRHFRSAGWFSTLDDSFFQFIHLFHPPEMRSPPTTSLVVWAREDMRSLRDMGSLYITKGDMDLDRPTADTYEKHRKRDRLDAGCRS
ncbi:MAG: GNAT family N-acetyltransferase [Nitrosopumilus sp.]|nr:GNAT family N-acetyltransferase [Nitrosopumilus sp.]